MRRTAWFAGPVLAGACSLLLGVLAGCNEHSEPQVPLARVDVTTAEVVEFAPRATLTGTVSDAFFRYLI